MKPFILLPYQSKAKLSLSCLILLFMVTLSAQPDLMNVMTNGNVGIGLSVPEFPLDISATQGVLRMTTTTHTNGSVIDLKNIAGSPTFLGAINFNNTSGNAPGQIAYTGNNAMTFRVNVSERLRIGADGHVGIGTTNPLYKLHVSGSEIDGGVGHFANILLSQENGYGVYGVCDILDDYGYGGYFEGGKVGTFGQVTPNVSADNMYFGLYGRVETQSAHEGNGDNIGVYGVSYFGKLNYGVYGEAVGGTGTTNSYGVYGTASGSSGGLYAGFFQGNVHVNGTFSKTSGSFKIDHPLEPENKYLYHSFVESPDMMNIYNGNVITNAGGEAIVELPDYFEPLNKEFRYQLTVIGQFAQAIILEEIYDNKFSIKTDKPNVKVSWQVTGIRQDAYAKANRIQVEEEKPAHERGKYLNPEVFGMPHEMGVNYHPEHEAERSRMKEEIGKDERIVQGKETYPENRKN